MKPRNVEASSAGSANTMSNASHVGRCKICSTSPSMGNILTHCTSPYVTTMKDDAKNVSKQRGMVTRFRVISVSSWYSTSPVATTGPSCRGGMCAGKVRVEEGPVGQVHVHAREQRPGNAEVF